MKGENIVHTAVERASRVSPRDGKWANVPEIKAKTNPQQSAIGQILTELVRDSRIERKAGFSLYRPSRGGAPGVGGVGSSDRGKPPRDRGKKPHDHHKDPRREHHKDPRKDPRRDGKPPRHDKPPRKPDSKGDPARRERENKIQQDRARQRREHSTRRIGKTIARGVGTQAVSAGIASSIGQQTAQKAIYTAIL